MHRRLLITLSLITLPLITMTAHAQRTISAPRFAAGFNRGAFNGGLRSSFYSLPLYDPLYADFLSSTGYPVASQPPVIILQAPPAAAPAADRFAPPSQPLLIELQGDRYVRVIGPETSGAEMIGPDLLDGKLPNQKTSALPPDSQHRPQRYSSSAIPSPATPESLPAVLIFRDGHHEEASEYTIADGVLYISGDPYTGGPWTRKINLSSLNLPETITSNQARGVRFRVPQSPNEVVVRP
jgi:hypothetical protein